MVKDLKRQSCSELHVWTLNSIRSVFIRTERERDSVHLHRRRWWEKGDKDWNQEMLPWWFSGKESTCNAGDCLQCRRLGSTPGSGRSLGEGNGNPLQYSCLELLMDRGAWWATVPRVAKNQTRVKQLSTFTGILRKFVSISLFIFVSFDWHNKSPQA